MEIPDEILKNRVIAIINSKDFSYDVLEAAKTTDEVRFHIKKLTLERINEIISSDDIKILIKNTVVAVVEREFIPIVQEFTVKEVRKAIQKKVLFYLETNLTQLRDCTEEELLEILSNTSKVNTK